jgi:ComF family protein
LLNYLLFAIMNFLSNFLDILFPRTCAGCDNSLATGENLICSECFYELPKTGYWKEEDNPVARMFWGRVYLQNASSFLHFQKGSRLQNMIHHLKYKNMKEIGTFLGKLFGSELQNTPYSQVDLIVPVPLHKSKIRKRGYNQSEWIAKGISEILKVPIEVNAIERYIASDTQTRKSRFDRWENVKNIFRVIDPETFKGKHILLVDDVLTTGATLEACAISILEIPDTKVSVGTLAFATI